jgi:diaminopimelate epimerase
MQIELTKHHGLGNDFLVMNVAQADASFDWPTLAQRWCDRDLGLVPMGCCCSTSSRAIALEWFCITPMAVVLK